MAPDGAIFVKIWYNGNMKKLILVYNPLASNIAEVESAVLAEARGLRGYLVGKYKVQKAGFAENVAELMRMMDDGDLVVAAGGDGTASLAFNAVVKSGKEVTFAALGYGNFNDVAGMLGEKSLTEIVRKYEAGEVSTAYPLEVKVNGEVWRYALGYATAGLLAEATTLLNQPKVRKKLDAKGRRSTVFSWWEAVKWYLRNHRRKFLVAGKLNGQEFSGKMTDYLAVNGPTLARVMYGGEFWREERKFGSALLGLGKFWKMVRFGLAAINKKKGVSLNETEGDVIEFAEVTKVGLQAEGEYEELDGVEKIEVRKAQRGVIVVARE